MKLDYIDHRFGTWRGVIRLALAHLAAWAGQYRQFSRIDWDSVSRLVFVCQGNICRSPFGHYYALGYFAPERVTSIGLNTETGLPAFETGIEVATMRGIDETSHVATDISDFEIKDGDLYLVMEDRHFQPLHDQVRSKDTQIALLGLWSQPRFPLLYDPHKLSAEYFDSCFARIETAVQALAAEAPPALLRKPSVEKA